MRISRKLLTLVVMLSGLGGAVLAAAPRFETPEAALEQGVSAFRGGYLEIAVPALEFAARSDNMMAKYYLALIYSDNMGARTDHAKAYRLYRDIVDVNAEIDADMDPRAPIVGRSMTALARYIKRGLPEIGMRPDAARAASLFRTASLAFGDEDAQFELAKLQLEGIDQTGSPRTAIHWLSVLSENGHAGAQAFLADLLWRGKHVKADSVKALALIAVAVENAAPQERLWIEDIYQGIYCGTAKGIHKQATGVVAEWGERYGDKIRQRQAAQTEFGALNVSPARTCDDGNYVGRLLEDGSKPAPPAAAITRDDRGHLEPSTGATGQGGFAYGATAPSAATGFGLRDVSTPAPGN